MTNFDKHLIFATELLPRLPLVLKHKGAMIRLVIGGEPGEYVIEYRKSGKAVFRAKSHCLYDAAIQALEWIGVTIHAPAKTTKINP